MEIEDIIEIKSMFCVQMEGERIVYANMAVSHVQLDTNTMFTHITLCREEGNGVQHEPRTNFDLKI